MIGEFIDNITKGDFVKAKQLMNTISFAMVRDKLYTLAYDTGSIAPYSFVCYLLEQDERPEYHYLASEILSMGLPYLTNSYNASLFHAKRALELEPDNIIYKEYLLLFYEMPEKLISQDEAISIARDILKVNPLNKAAHNVLKDISYDI